MSSTPPPPRDPQMGIILMDQDCGEEAELDASKAVYDERLGGYVIYGNANRGPSLPLDDGGREQQQGAVDKDEERRRKADVANTFSGILYTSVEKDDRAMVRRLLTTLKPTAEEEAAAEAEEAAAAAREKKDDEAAAEGRPAIEELPSSDDEGDDAGGETATRPTKSGDAPAGDLGGVTMEGSSGSIPTAPNPIVNINGLNPSNGLTALHVASYNGNVAMVRLLLELGGLKHLLGSDEDSGSDEGGEDSKAAVAVHAFTPASFPINLLAASPRSPSTIPIVAAMKLPMLHMRTGDRQGHCEVVTLLARVMVRLGYAKGRGAAAGSGASGTERVDNAGGDQSGPAGSLSAVHPVSRLAATALLFDALQKNNHEILEALLKGGIDPEGRVVGGGTEFGLAGDGKGTPLHMAIVLNQPECVRVLLRYGANPNAPVSGLYDWALLGYTCPTAPNGTTNRSMPTIMPPQFNAKASAPFPLYTTLAEGATPLHIVMSSASADNAELLQLLLTEAGEGTSPSDVGVVRGRRVAMVPLDVNARDVDGCTALLAALLLGEDGRTHGSVSGAFDGSSHTKPNHFPCRFLREGSSAWASAMLRMLLLPSSVDPAAEVLPLLLATAPASDEKSEEEKEATRALMAKSKPLRASLVADPSVPFQHRSEDGAAASQWQGVTPLHIAARNGDVELLTALLEASSFLRQQEKEAGGAPLPPLLTLDAGGRSPLDWWAAANLTSACDDASPYQLLRAFREAGCYTRGAGGSGGAKAPSLHPRDRSTGRKRAAAALLLSVSSAPLSTASLSPTEASLARLFVARCAVPMILLNHCGSFSAAKSADIAAVMASAGRVLCSLSSSSSGDVDALKALLIALRHWCRGDPAPPMLSVEGKTTGAVPSSDLEYFGVVRRAVPASSQPPYFYDTLAVALPFPVSGGRALMAAVVGSPADCAGVALPIWERVANTLVAADKGMQSEVTPQKKASTAPAASSWSPLLQSVGAAVASYVVLSLVLKVATRKK